MLAAGTMAQQILEELAQGHALLQNGLIEQRDLDYACESLLQRLISSKCISLADKQEALMSAKNYGISQPVLLDAGKQLLQLRVEQCRLSDPADEGMVRGMALSCRQTASINPMTAGPDQGLNAAQCTTHMPYIATAL